MLVVRNYETDKRSYLGRSYNPKRRSAVFLLASLCAVAAALATAARVAAGKGPPIMVSGTLTLRDSFTFGPQRIAGGDAGICGSSRSVGVVCANRAGPLVEASGIGGALISNVAIRWAAADGPVYEAVCALFGLWRSSAPVALRSCVRSKSAARSRRGTRTSVYPASCKRRLVRACNADKSDAFSGVGDHLDKISSSDGSRVSTIGTGTLDPSWSVFSAILG